MMNVLTATGSLTIAKQFPSSTVIWTRWIEPGDLEMEAVIATGNVWTKAPLTRSTIVGAYWRGELQRFFRHEVELALIKHWFALAHDRGGYS